ncbi:uncharacterized protein VTP21DRAFT_2645 [Calcarisporiella thermophila]|uniref:uncharacterized protein n=1 Tax=Calcarisporiella thermophila TaxID=911321 RepID=UPI0037449B7E
MNLSLQASHLFDLSNKVALVTGGGTGIGLMIAKTLEANGAKVYIVGRRLDVLKKVSGGNIIALQGDVSSRESVDELVKSFPEDRLDILVNNAGVAYPGEEYDQEKWRKTFQINLESIHFMVAAFLPLLKATKGHPGKIINIGSTVTSIKKRPNEFRQYAYPVSKAGVNHLSKILAADLASENITVNVIEPGAFPSEMFDKAIEHLDNIMQYIPFQRLGSNTDIGGVSLLLASDAGDYITGQIIAVDGGTWILG